MKSYPILLTAFLTFSASQSLHAQGNDNADITAYNVTVSAPKVPTDPLRQAYFGDLHVHTGYSLDAYVGVGTRLLPNDALRFAQGLPVSVMGQQVRRSRPLDFMAVTDHAEHLGVLNQLDNPDSELSNSLLGKFIRPLLGKSLGDLAGRFTFQTRNSTSPAFPGEVAAGKSAWSEEIAAANRNNKPGVFTAFIAFEYSSAPNASSLHRNVIFRGDVGPDKPFSALDSQNPEDLWTYVEKNRRAGLAAIAIPHTMNASNGIAFPWFDSYGKPIDRDYATRRASIEPLAEIFQEKGQSETNPVLDPGDEFANFEIYDYMDTRAELMKCGAEDMICQLQDADDKQLTESMACGAQAIDCRAGVTKRQSDGSYARDGYGRGLAIAEKVGANPYKFGVVGDSDDHTAMSESDQAATANNRNPKTRSYGTTSAGLTGIWAESNTRGSLFDALRRRETFATSGTEIKVRFFGGWDLPAKAFDANWVKTGYDKGVPMGSDMPARPATARAPRFLIWAEKDPQGANLDRIQVIKVVTTGKKVAYGDKGAYEDKIFDVARSPTGGAAELKVVWQDPTFDPSKSASYYLRVLETPTPRWSTLFAAKQGIELPPNVPRTVQQRAVSSPIWYSAPARSQTP